MKPQNNKKENIKQKKIKKYQDISQDIIINGIYKHFKGGKYKVIRIALDSETKEEYVVYEQLYDSEFPKSTTWIRKKSEFLEIINRDGKNIKRFKLIKSPTNNTKQ